MRARRVVESQAQTSTRKLVDSLEEQELLEELLEEVKPPVVQASREGLHYLLHTPFRYPPLRYGSRFGTRAEPSLWYGSGSLFTAFAEVAYYRLLFLAACEAELGTVSVELTAFSVQVDAERGVRLTEPPFEAYRSEISAPAQYDASQALGRALRAAGVQAFLYFSARDADDGVNVGLFEPAFSSGPEDLSTFACHATRRRVELARTGFSARRVFIFEREQFEVAGALPAPAV